MANNKKKKSKKAKSEEVGNGKPQKQHKRSMGRKGPSPKGRPKKIHTLKEALQISFNKKITTKNEKGDLEEVTCLEALASKTIADAISNDGPTRRLLYRLDLLNLTSKEAEFEYSPSEQQIIEVEGEYGELLHQWAESDPKMRRVMSDLLSGAIIDLCNEQSRKGENNE